MESVATQAAVEVALVMVASLFVLLAAVHLIDRLKSRPVQQPERLDNRISEREMQLVGEDWRDHVISYIRIDERRKEIVEGVCHERH